VIQFYVSGVGSLPLVALSQRRNRDVSEVSLRTLGSLPLALLLQAQGGAGGESLSGAGIFSRVTGSSPIAQGVLLTLVMLSIVSWSIFLYKWWTFRRIRRRSDQFLDVFRRSNKFSEVQAVCRSLDESPLVGLFQSGYAELTAQLRQTSPDVANGPNPRTPAARPILKSLPAVDRALLRASAVEVNKLERRVSFLATTASIAPFIGLFGTVWGIMNAFQSIGQTGSTSIAAVGPSIADALVATAAGLAAAIPAVLFYNHLTQRTKLFASDMDDFSMEFLNIVERNFT
jgi:biopolymer transport protein TolQ